MIVSTDDEEIAQVSRENGAEVPFIRPEELAQDTTPDLPVFRHALQWLADHDGFRPDIVVWLRPTAPLRTSQDISEAVRILCESDVDCVRIDSKSFGCGRDELIAHLGKLDIDSRPFFPCVHTQPIYATGQQLPVAEHLAANGLSLPSFTYISNDNIQRISMAIRSLCLE